MKFRWLFVLLFLSGISFGQKDIEKIESLMSAEKTEQARPLIDNALLESENNPKLLLYKGMIIQNQIEITTPSIEKRIILDSAYYFYTQSYRYDTKKYLTNILAENLESVAQQLAYTGMEQFNEAKYSSAIETFEKAILISDLEYVNHLDTMLWYNSAITSEKLSDYTKAEKYYMLILKYNPNDWNTIVALANTYKLENKENKYISLIKKANNENPRVGLFYNEIIGYYLEKKDNDSALIYLDKLIALDKYNDKMYYLKGSILQEKGELNQANLQYEKSIEINPENVDANYNLAVNKYNNAMDLLKNKKLNKSERAKKNQYLEEVVQHLLIVRKYEPENKYLLTMLLVSYDELDLKNEKDKIEMEIKSLKEE